MTQSITLAGLLIASFILLSGLRLNNINLSSVHASFFFLYVVVAQAVLVMSPIYGGVLSEYLYSSAYRFDISVLVLLCFIMYASGVYLGGR